ncbi:MAG: tetratricopeptide repeat protein [Thioalkalivibrionaceae bacterium]
MTSGDIHGSAAMTGACGCIREQGVNLLADTGARISRRISWSRGLCRTAIKTLMPFVVVVVAGCTVPLPRSEPLPPRAPPAVVVAPDVRPEVVPAPTQPRRERAEREVQPSAPQASTPPRSEVAPSRSSAAETLARASSDAVSAGDLRTGAAQLERALRIAPRDAELWLALAKVRFQQGDAAQAEQMGLRAVQLAPNQAQVKREAWEVIAAARELRGDRSGAEQAREAARALMSERV